MASPAQYLSSNQIQFKLIELQELIAPSGVKHTHTPDRAKDIENYANKLREKILKDPESYYSSGKMTKSVTAWITEIDEAIATVKARTVSLFQE